MIRIDEVYNNIFWSYINQSVPSTRIFFCDPPGRSDPDSLYNFGSSPSESNYIFFHDQEPIHLDIHTLLFDDVVRRNTNLNNGIGPTKKAIITSEWNSEYVDQVCSKYNWHGYYYFYHGWAALDWYRGYNRTWLMPTPNERFIQKSFICPNRIIGGKRDHRVLLLYHLFKQHVSNALISCPQNCPLENQTINEISSKFKNQYPDIDSVFEKARLPLNFPNETGHPMHSCWLSLFNECSETLAYVVTETVYTGKRNHLTEKTFKPICQQMPFVMVSTVGSLEYLRRYGFKTFNLLWDEDYDNEHDDITRLEKIAKILKELDNMSKRELNQLYAAAQPMVEHNYQHFYNGNFEKILWKELTQMLDQIKNDFRI